MLCWECLRLQAPSTRIILLLAVLKRKAFRATVFLGVVPALGLFEARKFEDNHPFGLPIAFEGLGGTTPYDVAAPILLNRRGHERDDTHQTRQGR